MYKEMCAKQTSLYINIKNFRINYEPDRLL